ncbi:cobalamin B12-binding domain-containing protein [Falsiroseomonas sp. CW058]|uniref:cobalamin B12-binding domain-containing protein n=1 Tax=Falsiroseomonas sp. CW058 TaxID=3388664 RepID=UPI003D30F398
MPCALGLTADLAQTRNPAVPDPRRHAPFAAPAYNVAERRRGALLARTLETEVIPRLVLARRGAAAHAEVPGAECAVAAEDVALLAGLVTHNDLPGGMAHLGVLRARGIPIERLYLDLLAPVARRLGEMWEEDRCDFTTVTIGLCCLQQLVMEHSAAFRPRAAPRDLDRRVLLTPLPGEQHSFGLLMVGEFFRRQGWDVHSATGAGARELAALVRRQWFAMVGLSVSSDSRLEGLASIIRELRRESRNRQLGVLVGGRVFSEQPELATLVGADATAQDGQQAVLKAETMLALLGRED